jgi:SAM-dependent methyltransferase
VSAATPWHRRLLERCPEWIRRRLLRLETAIEAEVRRFAASLAPGSRVLDAGAGEGSHARHFAHCRYIGVDLGVGDTTWDYSRLDARADLARLPFPDRAFAAALNIVVLEHTSDPGRVVAELARVLDRGAPLLLVAPQEWGVHQPPHDYFRFTRYGLESLLTRSGFERLEIRPAGGFFTLLGRRVLDSVLYFQGGARWLLLPFVAALAVPAGLLVPLLDFLDREKNTTLAYICVARKQ